MQVQQVTCSVYFDATIDGYRGGDCTVAAASFAVMVAIVWLFQSRIPAVRLKGSIIAAGVFGLACTGGWALIAWSQYLEVASALKTGCCTVVEGVVTDFHPMPFGGHSFESFGVAGVRFRYSDWNFGPGFHQSVARGGPIHSGLIVRIHRFGNDIARLEICE